MTGSAVLAIQMGELPIVRRRSGRALVVRVTDQSAGGVGQMGRPVKPSRKICAVGNTAVREGTAWAAAVRAARVTGVGVTGSGALPADGPQPRVRTRQSSTTPNSAVLAG